MDKGVAAVSEEMLLQIRLEDLQAVETMVCSGTNRDPLFWRSVLRREFKIDFLMDTVLQTDIMLPKLLVCGFETMCPFHLAGLRGAECILAFFLDNLKIPADMALSSSGSTALHMACFSGQLSTAQMLVQTYKADVEKRDNYGWSALHYASAGGYLEVVEFLVEEAQAKVAARDLDGTTPAFRAENFGHINIVSYFVRNQTDGDQLLLARPDLGNPVGIEDVYSNTKLNAPNKSGIKENDYISKVQCSYTYDNNENPYLIQINKTSNNSIQSKITTPSSQSKLNKSNLNQSEMNNNNSGKLECNRSNFNELDEPQLKREESKKILQKVIGEELKSVLSEDPYLKPNEPQFLTGNLDSLGFNTLKAILREEFLKYRPMSSNHTIEKSPLLNSPLYESIRATNRWVEAGETLRGQRAISSLRGQRGAPALPPLRKSTVASDFEAMRLFNPSLDEPDVVKKAGIVLDVLESDAVVLDAVFRELGELLVGRQLGGKSAWKKLAYELPLRRKISSLDSRVSNIEKRFKDDEEKQCEAMLKDWRQHFGSAADLEALAAALQKCGLAKEIQTIADTKSNFQAKISNI